MHRQTLAALSKNLRDKKISSVELTSYFLQRIKQLDSQLNCFITITEGLALEQARAADQLIAAGKAGPLTGIPIAQKDIFCTTGVKTSCGSKMLDNFIAPYNATSVEQFNSAGVVLLGKTNMDEFAMGSSNETSYYGPVKNPWDLNKIPGGSSGGSAAAVAARLAPGATATDTGGSIRQPAALCGVTGLKPTYGRVSRYGMIAFASSMDQGGVIAQTAEDVALLLNTMAGYDPKDSTSINHPVPDYSQTLNDDLSGLKVGLPDEYFGQGLDQSIEQALEQQIKVLEKLGATFTKISLPHTDLSASVYYVLAPAECSANLARYDGVRYGYRCKDPVNLADLYKRTRSEGFGREVKRRTLIGTYVLSSGFYDAYYRKAQKVRNLIRQDFLEAFKQVDVILTPSTPTPAFNIGEKMSDPVAMYLSDVYTIAVNLAGNCALALPIGFSQQGLPIGGQLIGNYFSEAKLLNIAHRYQQETSWHQKIPEKFNE
ncbi:MAG: Asp-tRNA(Asn)/Glu-tRNA(Gln) amidotransferase subunit GatA [Proteobacteria bacterium]|nr:Asp-tRNA(Asn)/Glu-tRNA(Gln) amidotransferase subunit GatA [Pseudomonadota bacterium]